MYLKRHYSERNAIQTALLINDDNRRAAILAKTTSDRWCRGKNKQTYILIKKTEHMISFLLGGFH